MPPAKAAAERGPATRTSCVKGGVEALSQMVKTTRSPQQRRHSSISYTPRIWRGDATFPGPGVGGGSPRRVSGERESSLADPHGGPAATEALLVSAVEILPSQKYNFKKSPPHSLPRCLSFKMMSFAFRLHQFCPLCPADRPVSTFYSTVTKNTCSNQSVSVMCCREEPSLPDCQPGRAEL